ncbi:MAG: efflux RND transporter periplasmic adaptor subunit, partial [Actinobacteria bacterium]|nr:efflux RND transporter periplasmic adaptor subunit [Actinomycetota bacterium]
VIFLPGARRVGALLSAVGDAARPGRPVMTTSATARVVAGAIDAAKQSDLRMGDRVVVDLLNGTTTSGRISAVDAVASRVQGEREDDVTSVVAFDVVLDKPGVAGALDQAPVEVAVTDEKAKDVLSVPVTALLARGGGGYAVEVVRGGRPTLVAVAPGLYSDGGFVAVKGAVRAGEQVVVPR